MPAPTPAPASTLRIATYNIHKCQGLDRKVVPDRILRVIQELDADVLCLQEIVDAPGHSSSFDQAGFLMRNLPGYTAAFANNRPLHGGGYGNLTLTRLPLVSSHNHDLTSEREPRGALETAVALPHGGAAAIFNVHLGTGFRERQRQAHMLLTVLERAPKPRLVVGDFNEWTRGLTTQLLRSTFDSVTPSHALGFPRTFPGLLPLLTLDHCYFDPPFTLESTALHRSPTALIASDHLPLLATFSVPRQPHAPPGASLNSQAAS